MKPIIGLFLTFCLLSIGSVATADIFFEEQFNGTALDPSVWRTEILTGGARWCDSNPGQGEGPGTWVAEGEECYGVAAGSPYGNATLSDGLLHLSSTNGQAFPYLASRLPGPVEVFPSSGDWTLRVRMRFDHITLWGTGLVVLQTQSTESIGDDPPNDPYESILLSILSDHGSGFELYSALDGSYVPVAFIPSAAELHEFELECVGTSFTILVDGQAVYGPVTSALRPTAVLMGSPVLAYWYPTDWCWFSVDYFQVEVPGPVPVVSATWGTIKAMHR